MEHALAGEPFEQLGDVVAPQDRSLFDLAVEEHRGSGCFGVGLLPQLVPLGQIERRRGRHLHHHCRQGHQREHPSPKPARQIKRDHGLGSDAGM